MLHSAELLLHWHNLFQRLPRNNSCFGGLVMKDGEGKGKLLTALACHAGSVWRCWWKNDLTPSFSHSGHVSDVGSSEE